MLSRIALLFIFLHQPLEHQASLWSLRKCYWQCNCYHSRVCLDCIAGHIALIASLRPYRWFYRFDRSNRIALAISLIVSLWSLWLHWSGRIVDRICAGKCSLLSVSFSLVYSSKSKRFKTWFIALMNPYLHMIIHQDLFAYVRPLDHLELRLDLFP